MTTKNSVFVGIFADSNSLNDFNVTFGYICIENGKITKTGSIEEFDNLERSGSFKDYNITKLNKDQFIIPGFVDCHTHAPQFPNIGLGLDRPLLEWLAKYTFPLEKKYKDAEFAARIYDQVVQRLLKNGTTTACYFGSLHVEGTLELVKSAIKHHQRALIGKVSMNKENDAGYYNDTEKELTEVETFVQKVLALQNDLVEPVVTPRFALSCDKKLMDGLAKIANKYNCRIQSHISENLQEIEYVLETNENCKSYGDVYDKSGILNNRCIMAHAVHLTDEELTLLRSRGVSVAHCPASNTRLKSGLCPVRRLLNANITVGLGTDVSGGDSATILDAIRRSMDVSMCLELQGNPQWSLDWKEAFYLATLGGAKCKITTCFSHFVTVP
ncbi:guanine deaminase isoform X2 [Anticarsia gemmatalis]|uniref:guanine deaminase isoform X2 n=1 Tax=Anticarsia gemmatalis TaxID=129554 RepID=UPI003F75B703